MADKDIVERLNRIVDEKVAKKEPLLERFFTEVFLVYVEKAIQSQGENTKELIVDLTYPKFSLLSEYGITSLVNYEHAIYDCIDRIHSISFRYYFDKIIKVRTNSSLMPSSISFENVRKNDVSVCSFSIIGKYIPPPMIKKAFND